VRERLYLLYIEDCPTFEKVGENLMTILEELKPHLKILEKVQKFERKAEYNRFLLILTISGFVVIIGGWVSYIFHRFLGTDPTFFMFGMTGNPDLSPIHEPILFSTIWLLYAIPILSIISLTTGSSGILSWNKAYRKIGIIAVGLFFVVQVIILILGVQYMNVIPLIWGTVSSAGFLLSGRIMYQETKMRSTKTSLNLLGVMSLFLGILSFSFIPNEVAMLFLTIFLGVTLSLSGFLVYLKTGKL
jgi:hypothetical protein